MIMLHRVHCALDLEVQLISSVFVTKQEDTKKTSQNSINSFDSFAKFKGRIRGRVCY